MPIIIGATILDDTTTSALLQQQIGLTSPAPPPPTAPATLGSAVVVSTTPVAGQGIALDFNGSLPTVVTNGLVQLANPGQHKIIFGTGTIVFPGGSNSSNLASVAHGLGAAPIIVLVCGTSNNGLTAFPVFQTSGYTSTTFSAKAWTVDAQSPALNSTSSFVWLAIS